MNEFDLQGLEREIQAWRRRLDSHDAPQVRAALNDIAREVAGLRIHAGGATIMVTGDLARYTLERRLCGLLSLYDLASPSAARIGSS